MYNIDFDDTQALWKFSLDSCKLAEKYQKARESFAIAVKTLKIALAKAYSKSEIKESISEEKAYLLLAADNVEIEEALKNKVEFEQTYKGILKVLEARQALISFNQSIIKNKPTE